MNTTPEQRAIIDYITTHDGLVMVNSVAGSGKTTLLVEIANVLAPTNALYLAYNKSVATEAQQRFPKQIKCCTTHSLAYGSTVRPMGLRLGFLSYRQIPGRTLQYEQKLELIEHIREFCLSEFLCFSEFAKDRKLSPKYVTIATNLLDQMQHGKIECTHDFYLKLFHILLANGSLDFHEFDFIAIDEAGDVNPVTLAIFNLLPAKKKIMVGDPYQNIYGFNHTVNCFKLMAGQGHLMSMTQSFRTSESIAKRIQNFCRAYMDPTMTFTGTKIRNPEIHTRAFIARTNAALIDKMLKLNMQDIGYGLTRPAKKIFELPLCVLGLKHSDLPIRNPVERVHRGFVAAPGYSHLLEDVDRYHEDPEVQAEFSSLYGYLLSQYSDDIPLTGAINLILKHSPSKVLNCYEEARRHERSTQTYTLGTCHSTKGLEFDSVEIADDLNLKVADILNNMEYAPDYISTKEDLAELNLYYVACSRARVELLNATCLKD